MNQRQSIFLAACTLSSLLILGGCSSRQVTDIFEETDSGPTADQHVDLDKIPDAVPKKELRSRTVNPDSYEVLGKRYEVMDSEIGFTERGIASWYGNKFHGNPTASGEIYDMFGMTAAHKNLPLPCYVEVTNIENGRKIIVKVNDRGPFHQNRIIDLSYAGAAKLGITARGTGLVEIRAIDTTAPAAKTGQMKPVPAVSISTTTINTAPKMFIQAGAFGSRDNAERLQNKLQNALNKPVRVARASVNEQIFYRVQVGPVVQVSAADAISRSLEEMGMNNLKTIIE